MVSHIAMRLMSIRELRISEKLAKCLGWPCVIYWLLFVHMPLIFLDEKPTISIVSGDGKYNVF